MKKGFFALSLSVFMSVGHAKEDARIKHEMEAGFKIRAEAAQRILVKYPFEAQSREDYYVDIYDGHNFLVIPSPQLFRFRLKTTDSKAVFQINTKERITTAECQSGETIRIEEKAVGELRLGHEKAQEIARLIEDQLHLMNGQPLTSVGRKILELHRQIEMLPIPLKEKLLTLPGDRPWVFTGTHTSSKLKYKLLRDLGWGPLEISVTEGQDYVGVQLIQNRSEIEFQPADKMSVPGFVASACAFLQELQLSEEDRDLDLRNPQETTLPLLKKYNAELGLPD